MNLRGVSTNYDTDLIQQSLNLRFEIGCVSFSGYAGQMNLIDMSPLEIVVSIYLVYLNNILLYIVILGNFAFMKLVLFLSL